MPSVKVTPEAASELRLRIRDNALPTAVVVICRLNKGADLRRGASGEAVWTTERDSITWSCEVVAVPDSEFFSSVEVDGIRFAFSEREVTKIKAVEVSLLNGIPHVRVDA